jgi:cytochrome b561
MASPRGYSTLQIILHWLIAALVVFQLVVNEAVRVAFKDRLENDTGDLEPGALLHVGVGLTILALALLRLTIRLRRGTPPLDRDVPKVLRWLAIAVHVLLYGFIIGVPLTGAIAWFGHSEMVAGWHELGRLVLIPAILAHVAGALVEHFVFHNDSIKRMFKATAN